MKSATCLIFSFFSFFSSFAIVSYDHGITIKGVQLFRDRENENDYYYLPRFPRLSTKEDGSFELLFMRYAGKDKLAGGGIFHALVKFDVPEELLLEVEKELKKQLPNAIVKGQIPLKQAGRDDSGNDAQPGFTVVSSILKMSDGQPNFASSLITSGFAPFTPGSKAAIAATLNEDGASLLYESLRSATSDVSISVTGYFDAAIKGYNAVVTAEASTIYEHFSKLEGSQHEYNKTQIRNVMDKLIQSKALDIKVFDASLGGIKNDDFEQILNIVTNKITELMFNSQTGWAKIPAAEVAIEKNQIPGRQKKGFLSGLFSGLTNAAYVTDNQFVLKNRKDITINKFYLNLSKQSVIQVPINASGNIGGIFQELGKDEKYFKIVNLESPTFQKREVFFTVDRDFSSNNPGLFNFVTVQFRKKYNTKQPEITKELMFNYAELEKGVGTKSILYSRLGETGVDWLNYEYKVSWSFKGIPQLNIPKSETEWIKSNEMAIILNPPFVKLPITVEVDKSKFEEQNIKAVGVSFLTILNSKANKFKEIIFSDSDQTNKTTLYILSDPNESAAYQIKWYGSKQEFPDEPMNVLTGSYLNLVPPNKKP